MQEQAGSQFIMTTFKAHMVECANKIFEVTFRGNKSAMKEISKDKAIKLVDES